MASIAMSEGIVFIIYHQLFYQLHLMHTFELNPFSWVPLLNIHECDMLAVLAGNCLIHPLQSASFTLPVA